MDKKKVAGGAGITAGGDVSIGDITGQLAIGEYINQFKIEKPSGDALVKLIDFLDRKRQESVNKEILKSYTPSALPDYPPRLRAFVTENRVDELTQALIYLQDHRILLVSGVGGVGKTTLARALVEPRPVNVSLPFWFDFGKKMDAKLRDVLEELASYMNTPDIAKFKAEGREAGLEDINGLTDELQKREPVWLVFDNLETILDNDRHFHDRGIDSLFAALRGSTHHAKIIVTSRTLPILGNGESLIDIIGEEKQELKGLKTNFAVDFLTKNGLDRVEREKLEELANGVDGHPLALRLLIGLVKEFGVPDTLKDLSMYQKSKEDTIKKARRLFDKLAGDEKGLLERISVYRQPESRTAIKEMFFDKTPVDVMKKLIDKSLLETDHDGNYWLHPLVREFSYNDLENKREAHRRAGKYYAQLEKTPENILETTYHMIKNFGAIDNEAIEYLIETPSDANTDLLILDVLENNTIQSPAIFDLIEKILANESPEVRFIGVGTLIKNRNLDVERAIELLERRIKDTNETESVRKRSISSLSAVMDFSYEKIIPIFEEIVNNGDAEFFESVCRALKNAGIKNEKTIQILRRISTYDLNRVTYTGKNLVLDILDDWDVLDTSLEIDYLNKLRGMGSSHAITYVEDLMFGSNQFNRFNINYFFFAWVLKELYKVKKQESVNLMKKLIEKVLGTMGISWTVSRVLIAEEGFQYDTIRDFITSENFLVRLSGFLTILQAYSCLDFFQRKYAILDEDFEEIYGSVKKNSIELLGLLTKDEDELLREVAIILLQEIVKPSEGQKIKIKQSVLDIMAKGFLKIISPDLLVKFLGALGAFGSVDGRKRYYLAGILVFLSWTQLNPEKIYPTLKVQNVYSDMAAYIISFYYHEFRKSPEKLLDIINKFGFESTDYITRIIAIHFTHGLIPSIPEKLLETYESLLLNPEYQDKGPKVALIEALFLMRTFFAFIENYKTEHNSEINNIVYISTELIQKLAQDEDKEVGMLADLALNGIRFKDE